MGTDLLHISLRAGRIILNKYIFLLKKMCSATWHGLIVTMIPVEAQIMDE